MNKTVVFISIFSFNGPGNALMAFIKANKKHNITIVSNYIDPIVVQFLNDNNVSYISKGTKHFWKNYLYYNVLLKRKLQKFKEFCKDDIYINWEHTKNSTKLFKQLFTKYSNKLVLLHQDINRIPYFNSVVKSNYYSHYLFCGNDIKNKFLNHYPTLEDISFTVTNTIDVDRIEANRRSDFSLDSFTCVTVGGIRPQKDIITMVKAFEIIEKKNIPLKLLVIGDGTLKEQIMLYLSSNKIKNVKLLGAISNPIPYIEKSFAYVSSSLHEGLSISVLEAHYFNKLLVLSKCTGNNEIINNVDCAYGFNVGNERELAKKLEFVYKEFQNEKCHHSGKQYSSYERNSNEFNMVLNAINKR